MLQEVLQTAIQSSKPKERECHLELMLLVKHFSIERHLNKTS